MSCTWRQCFWTCLRRRPKQLTLLLVGINNAGKTTLLNSLQGDLLSETVPTYGFNTADITAPDCTFKLYDLGGGRSIRRIWGVYAPEVHGVIYVVDSADPASFPEARSVLQQLLAAPQLAGKPLLLFANKQDLPGAQPLEAVEAAMNLQQLQTQQSNPCTAIACTAKGTAQQQQADPGLRQGLRWLQETLGPLYGQLHAKIEREAAAAKAEEEQRRQERQERARQSKLAREKQQEQQQIEQQHPVQLRAQQPDKKLHELAGKQAGQQQQQMPEQLIDVNWPDAEHSTRSSIQRVLSSQIACSECSALTPVPAVPGTSEANILHGCDTAAAAESVPVAAVSSCTSASTASLGAAGLPSLPDQQCSQQAAPAAAAAAGQPQPPNKPGMAISLLNLLQAAVSLPGSATAAPPAAPDFCDLRQAAHDLCGPTPRSHSISSDASSLLVSEASQQVQTAAVPTTSGLQHSSKAASAEAAGGRRVSCAGVITVGGNTKRGGSSQSSISPGKAASQAPRKVARSTSLPGPGTGLYGSGGGAVRSMAPRRTACNGRTSLGQGNRVQPIA